MAHSPAPWKYNLEDFVRDAEGNIIDIYNTADAALIAAAPEMYNALVRAYLSNNRPINCGIEEAIAKAEGMSEFVNWFVARRHLNEWGGTCDVNIHTPNGLVRLTPKQINEGAERWEQAIAKAEGR